MKNLIEILVKALVDNTDEVVIEEEETRDAVKYRISVAPEDLGKVIGKEGRIANAIRTVAKAANTRERRRVFVDIVP